MTIVEAIKNVLNAEPNGLTSEEIYEAIVEQNLYTFGAKNPISVVNSQIRRRCLGLDFPTAYPVKMFRIAGHRGKKNMFALYDEDHSSDERTQSKNIKSPNEELPEERIGAALQEHIASIKQMVFENVLHNSPAFFEHLVLDLLLKMGYGYGEQAGVVTGRPHDGGIDGIISEDKLGLDLIYYQAKRKAPGANVGRVELQAFIGAMGHVQKGIFITTSGFTKAAKAFMDLQQQKSIKLIDGELLSELLVKYEVGLLTAQTFKIYRLDTDYFNS